jgi:radical SAM superfamily enzyme YgiQ (UPF0313 family)
VKESLLKEFILRSSDAGKVAPENMKMAARSIRVVLIQPPTHQGVKSLLPQVDDEGGEGIGYKPPLGILYCATTLRERTSHEVLVIDAVAERLDFAAAVRRVLEFDPEVVGISAWTDFWYPAYRTGQMIKETLPAVHLCYGGPHLGIYPAETLAVPFVDSVVVGDGEIPFMYLCNMVANGVLDNSMRGLHLKPYGVKPNPDTFYIHDDLDNLPIPDRTLLPVETYSSVLGKESLVTTMITSRGCPNRCTFCKLNFQKTLARSAASVIEEFRRIRALGIREVEIYDDTFTWSKKRLIDICEGLIAADLGVKFAIRDRVSSSSTDLEVLRLLKKAGCTRIHYGIESGEQRILDRMRKNITIDQARKAVRFAKKAGVTVLTYFMFGNLDETEQDMLKTIDFALELDADFAQFSVTIPCAGTEMYLEALQKSIIATDYWRNYALTPVPDFVPAALIENLVTRSTLLAMRDQAVRRFYFRPKFILKELVKLRSAAEFVRKARMGMQLARSVYSR